MASRVLVADDDELTREILATILDLEEFEVDVAVNGSDALGKARDGDYDVVLLDWMMPGQTGVEVCAALKSDERTSSIPVVLLTAMGDPRDRDAGLRAGADAYLTKPFSPLSLIDTIRSLGV